LQLVLDALTVIFEVFSGFIDTLEEVHHISEANVDFHFIHILEDLCSFDLALDLQRNLRSIHTQFLLIDVYPFATIVSVFGTLIIFFEEDVALDFGDVFDEKRNDLSKLVNALPQAEDDGLLEEVEHRVKDLQIVDHVGGVLIVSLQKFLNIGQEIREVGALLFLFLTLVHTLCLGDVLKLCHLLFLLETIPLDDLSDPANGRKVKVIDICVMGDANERLMDVGIRETLDLTLRTIGLFQFLVQDLDVAVEKNS